MHVSVGGRRMHRETVVRSLVAVCAVAAVLMAVACEDSDPTSAKSTTTTSAGTGASSSTTAVTTSVQDAPAAPSNLGCRDLCATWEYRGGMEVGATVTIEWNDNSNNETGFVVERNGSAVETVAANATLYKDFVTANAGSGSYSYTYRVRAVNAAGFSAYSNSYTWSHFGTSTSLSTTTTSMVTTSSAFSTTTTTIYTTTSSMFTTSSIFF